jgi:hypothetical protein
MEPEFITYQKFNDPALADELAGVLEEHGIEYQIEEQSSGFDPSLVMSNATVDYAVKIKSEDFEQVNQLLEEVEGEEVNEIGTDYYLYSFTDDELTEVVTKSDEWSAFDVVLARKLLAERGKSISDEAIAAIHEKRIEELKEPDPPQTLWLVIGYMASLLGGVLGIFIGWHLMVYKKTLPNGERVFGYSENDRRRGKRIFYISTVIFAVAVAYRLLAPFSGDYS